MMEGKLVEHLECLSQKQLQNIIVEHYKFLVNKFEALKKENKGFKEQNMSLLINKTNEEIDFIRLQMQWYENFLYLDLGSEE